MNFMGVEFAPLSIPWSRRLQAAAALSQAFSFIFVGPVFMLVGIALLFSRFYYVPLLYFTWCVWDRNTCHNGGRRWEPFRNFIFFKYLKDYFPVTLVKTAELDPTKTYIFGAHPHGLMAIGMYVTFGSNFLEFEKVFPGIKARLLVLGGWFRLPVTREALLLSGSCSVSRQSIDCILSQGPGSAVALPIGGAAEVLQSCPNTVSLVLKNRKGFVRRAIANGSSLVPVFNFGENELYSQNPIAPDSIQRKIQVWLKKLIGVYVPIMHGRGLLQYTFGIVPYRKPITVVVGKPITVEKDTEPKAEEVDRIHAQYLTALEELFNNHKDEYGFKDVQMLFI